MITINVLYRNGNAMNVFTFDPDKSTITFESTYKVEELEVFSAYSMSNAINMAKLYQTMIHYGYHKYETLELMGCTSIKNMLGANYHNTKTKIKRNIGKNFSHISALL